MLSISASCFAFEPDNSIWEWVASDAKSGVFLQKRVGEVYKTSYGESVIITRTLTVDRESNEYIIAKVKIRHQEKSWTNMHMTLYDMKTRRALDSSTRHDRFEPIVPGTFAEGVYRRACIKVGLVPR